MQSVGPFQSVSPIEIAIDHKTGHFVFPLIILAAFVTVPIVEIALFITIGGQIGLWPTIAIVVATAVIGTALLRQQGLSVVAQAQADLDSGKVPLARIADGVFLLVAAVLLLTPGFMTDALGFLLFVPAVRRTIGQYLLARFVGSERVTVKTYHHGGNDRQPDIIEGEVLEADDVDPPAR